MRRLVLDHEEAAAVERLLDEVLARSAEVARAEFERGLTVAAHELPRRLRAFLDDFRLAESAGACVVSGLPVAQAALGPTPQSWRRPDAAPRATREELYLLLCACLIGDPFAWATQQDGALVHNLLPVREHETEQIGTGSGQTIAWHTEDAFHPYRGDYVGLMCLRNPDAVQTTFACVADLDLTAEPAKVLFEPRFYILPDHSHGQPAQPGADRSAGEWELLDAARARIRAMHEAPEPTPVLFGSRSAPYLRLDPYFMDLDRLDPQARAALDWLIGEIDRRLTGVALDPGDCCFVDNFRSVHGRNAFKARYDGTDRWLKRVNVTRNLRASRDARVSADSRVVF
jgi:enduracididine beta-hydroxylase